jgi:hypothetical protein
MKHLSAFGASIPVALLLLVASIATAEQRRDGSYLCVEEAAGGLFYNANSNKWEGATFRPSGKFILRLKFVQSRTEILGGVGGMSISVDDYQVTKEGGDSAVPCDRAHKKTAGLYDGVLICDATLHSYKFDFQTNRFLRAYLVGFIDGKDSNDNTPHVAGGTCTKID